MPLYLVAVDVGECQRGQYSFNVSHDMSTASSRNPERNSAMKVRPLYDRILVKRVETKEQVRGGIIIPDTAKEKPMEAKVEAVGDGKFNDDGKRVPLDVKKGDLILIGKYAGTEIKVNDEEYLILREDEVLAIVETK
jgi:chaperonin GroES